MGVSSRLLPCLGSGMWTMTFPKIVSSNIELVILEKEVRDGPRVGNVHRVVCIYPDGTIFVKRVFVDPSTIAFQKKILSSKIFDNFYEFSKSTDGDITLIHEYLLERGIHLDRWLGK
jgi:hypothetical protein